MKKLLLTAAFAAILLTSPQQAQALFIVDTGEPSTENIWFLDSEQWLAAQFNLSQSYKLTNIDGWITENPSFESNLTLALYGDAGSTPDVNNEIFSQKFTVNQGEGSNWYGLSGLDWDLNSGTYWAAFEVRPGDTYAGDMTNPSPSPLGNEAFYLDGEYIPFNSLDIGVRVQGDPASSSQPVVPEHSTVALLGIGLLAGVLCTKKLKS